ncbi:hypothetical protein FRC06_007486, partial [Ceratobasidium sp. 370]
SDPPRYDPLNLPRRTHKGFIRQALKVEASQTNREEDRLSRDSGITGISPLARLSSLEFPRSFPHDFMHMVFENIIPSLIDLWTHSGKYEDLGTGDEDYILSKPVWTAIGKACAASGDTIPAVFGCRVPNLSTKRRDSTAESNCLFAIFLGPALLRRRFRNHAYYGHFLKLVALINKCLSWTITREDLDFIREGFSKLYYRNEPDRLRACTLPLHALLHVADDIVAMGPPWCYWAFTMERFCGALVRANKSRRFPYSSLNRHIMEVTQLSQIKLICGLAEELNLEERRENMVVGTRYNGYPNLVFARPRRLEIIPPLYRNKIATYLSTLIGAEEGLVRREMQLRPFEQWGRMQQVDETRGGDLVRADQIGRESELITRNASYVKFHSFLDRWDWNRPRTRFANEQKVSFGRVERFVVIDVNFIQRLSERANVPVPHPDPTILAVVSPFPALKRIAESELIEYKLTSGKLAQAEIVDVRDIDSLIGRIKTSSASYVIDRTTIHLHRQSGYRSVRRPKDAGPFLRLVDPVALNIPHYPLIIKRLMDFNTVETRLQNSNPSKPPVDPLAPRYRTTDDFVSDIRQIFQNCYLFNGTEHFISHQARKLEDILDKQLKQMPPDEEPAARHESPPQPKKSSVPPARRQSTSVPTIRRNTPDEFLSPIARPKREIHPPPPKDLPYSDLPNGKRARKGRGRGPERDDGTAEQMRHCMKILTEFNKKSLYQIASPFYEAVDAAYVPTYYKVIKRPMDLGTMRKKLDEGDYPNAHAFHNDFRLMIKNCMTFNPPGTAVHSAGLEMDRIFKEKWKNLPPLRQLSIEEDQAADSSEDEHTGEDHDPIAMMESQIETMKGSLALLKAKKSQKPKAAAAVVAAPPPKEKKSPRAKAAKSAHTPKPAKNGAAGKESRGGAGLGVG